MMNVARETQGETAGGKPVGEKISVKIPKQAVVEVCDHLKLHEEVDCREENTGLRPRWRESCKEGIS